MKTSSQFQSLKVSREESSFSPSQTPIVSGDWTTHLGNAIGLGLAALTICAGGYLALIVR